MTESKSSAGQTGRTTLPLTLVVIGALVLVTLFIAILFPWESVARRLTHEISHASGSEIQIGELVPALSARGPVLAAKNVVVEHPAVERVRIERLEVAPRISTSWFRGEPTLRIWADSELAIVDGVLTLGEAPTYRGRVTEIQIERLPLRIDGSGIQFSGRLDADADVALDPRGVLTGRVEFDSPELLIQTDRLPIALPFTRASGVIEVLPSGSTRIESLALEGNLVEGELSGDIAMVHRSQSPPIDLSTKIRVIQPNLRGLAASAGIRLSPSGEASLQLGGTLDAPVVKPSRRGGRS